MIGSVGRTAGSYALRPVPMRADSRKALGFARASEACETLTPRARERHGWTHCQPTQPSPKAGIVGPVSSRPAPLCFSPLFTETPLLAPPGPVYQNTLVWNVCVLLFSKLSP
jgi:hypothetical protein